jgi:ribulose 1,5-bisphosphate synthetase/thiazole synthase
LYKCKFEDNSLINKMLRIDQLSYWERTTYFEGQDVVIVGAGIVGLTTAIAIKINILFGRY